RLSPARLAPRGAPGPGAARSGVGPRRRPPLRDGSGSRRQRADGPGDAGRGLPPPPGRELGGGAVAGPRHARDHGAGGAPRPPQLGRARGGVRGPAMPGRAAAGPPTAARRPRPPRRRRGRPGRLGGRGGLPPFGLRGGGAPVLRPPPGAVRPLLPDRRGRRPAPPGLALRRPVSFLPAAPRGVAGLRHRPFRGSAGRRLTLRRANRGAGMNGKLVGRALSTSLALILGGCLLAGGGGDRAEP